MKLFLVKPESELIRTFFRSLERPAYPDYTVVQNKFRKTLMRKFVPSLMNVSIFNLTVEAKKKKNKFKFRSQKIVFLV